MRLPSLFVIRYSLFSKRKRACERPERRFEKVNQVHLRPYQQEARDAILRQWEEGFQKTLLVMPTGCGKTMVFASVAEECVRQGERVLILAHRGELLHQAADRLKQSTGLGCAVEKAGASCLGSLQRVTVGSVQTLTREKRLSQFPPDAFNVIIVDEAHHCISESYRKILRYFAEAKVLGVTATPDRGDRKNLGEVFDSLAYEYPLSSAIREGYLSPIKAVTVPLKLDLSRVAIQSGDYRAADVDGALEPYLFQIAREMKTYCENRKTVVFLPLVRTARKLRDMLNAVGLRAAEVNGHSPDRKEILRDFEEGRYNVLCNAMLLTEGWDCPSVDCVVVLRPTKVRSLYCQMVGRGTRRCEGKKDLLLLDFLWHTQRHGLCHPAHLICESEEIAQQMTQQLAETAGCATDIEEARKRACQDVAAQREATLARQLDRMKHRSRERIDPVQLELSIRAEDLAHYVPSFPWEMAPPSAAQLAALERMGILTDGIDTAGKASLLLSRLDKRRRADLTTPRQIRCLENMGFRHVGIWSFETARQLIQHIAANGWQIPDGMNPAAYQPAEALTFVR